jgi:Leucine-rich repeat (LRR) protein
MIKETDGTEFVWTDHEIGLTWLLNAQNYHNIGRLNATRYGGYDDWRVPSLRELKTLSSNVKNKFGFYVKEALENKISGNYISSTSFRNETAWWSFYYGSSTTEEYSEGKIRWDSEGNYSGFDPDVYHNSARLILVRGAETHILSDWANMLRDWAERDNVPNFPVTQKSIEELEDLYPIYASSLPVEISRLPRLKSLTCLSYAEIENALFSATGLESLEIRTTYGNEPQLEQIPSSVANLRNLVSLKANKLGLKTIHEAIGSLRQLQILELSGNKIESLPNSIGDLGELRSLNLDGNDITFVPNSIGQLKKLEKLTISADQLPESIGQLKQLKELYITGNIERLPESIGNLAQLEKLDIFSDKLTEIPESLCNLFKLQELRIDAPLRIFPRRVDKLNSLKVLKIREALFEAIPTALFSMPWLHTLCITKTPIKRIPDEISGMTNLEQLDLSGTQIAELPRSFLLLEQLKLLLVNSTQFDGLPEWLSEMKSLSRIVGKGIKIPKGLKASYYPEGLW